MNAQDLKRLEQTVMPLAGPKRGLVLYLNRGVMFGPGREKTTLWAWWHMDQRPWNDGETIAMAVVR